MISVVIESTGATMAFRCKSHPPSIIYIFFLFFFCRICIHLCIFTVHIVHALRKGRTIGSNELIFRDIGGNARIHDRSNDSEPTEAGIKLAYLIGVRTDCIVKRLASQQQ